MRMESKIGPVQIGIVVMALATAGIHAWIASRMGGYLFYLNALGYIGLSVLLLLPLSLVRRSLPARWAARFRPVARWIFIAYTLLTILLWVFMGTRFSLAYIDKVVEVILVVLLWMDRSRG